MRTPSVAPEAGSRTGLSGAPLVAAVYARKSTEQAGVAEDARSVTRQVALARAFAEARGWTVDEAHVYVDDGISGAEFEDRPGIARLVLAAKARPRPFDAVITMDQDRIGRDQVRTLHVLNDLVEAGVRLFFYATQSELRFDSPTDKLLVSVINYGNEWYRHQVRIKTREAMRAKAAGGHVAGGRVYGYRNVRRGDHVEREVELAEATVIRRIFADLARGRGYGRIAHALNAEGVPCPRRGRGWATTAIRAMVFRELYRGRLVYGQTQWEDRRGTRVKVPTPASAWIIREAPALRIVPEDLWTAAHARLDRTRAAYARRDRPGGRPRGEPGIEARHLLSGFVVCGACGGAMHAIKRTSRRGAPRVYYLCNGWRVNGTCTNNAALPLPALDAAVLGALRAAVLTPDLVDDVVARAVALLGEEQAALTPRRRALETDLRAVERELRRLTAAIAAGEALPSLLDAVRVRERRRADLQAQLEHVDGLSRATRPVAAELRATLRERMESWEALLAGNPTEARPVLRQLLVGRLVLTPHARPDGRWYEFTGTATSGGLLAGAVLAVVPPG